MVWSSHVLGKPPFGCSSLQKALILWALALRKSLQLLHPAVLDGALQLLVECASRGAKGTTFL